MSQTLKGVAIGAGYFSHFHFDAWNRIDSAEIVAVCDTNQERAREVAKKYGIGECYSDFHEMLRQTKPDFVDVITRPQTHLSIVRQLCEYDVAIMCQKPLAPTFDEAVQLVTICRDNKRSLMVHENFRFQPWYRHIKGMLNEGAIGDRLHTLSFRNRAGDGWGDDAYLARQPYFQTMERFLIFEAGIHTVDSFRYLAGDIEKVFCTTRKLNPVIAGEDTAIALFQFSDGAVGMYDANRYNESTADNPRYTFGQLLIEGSAGSIRLYEDGRISLQRLGMAEEFANYEPSTKGFAGDCVFDTQQHFVDALLAGGEFETRGEDYLKSIAVQEAMYQSAQTGQWESPQLPS
ncbi:MAG TPA: gfo/Idh/MocA family oxidoreductase [Planctomycetaceae bacterium]|nr:gfo/Idh/MocA family oxidoreductase [Planctomycetaceae bacterium]